MGFEMDSAFIQEKEHRPNPTTVEGGGIPLIDLSPFLNSPNVHDEALESLFAEVEAACSEWGFFQVTNHGVPSSLLRRVESSAREFFALEPDEKRRIKRDEVNPLGYYDTEHTKNVRDWKEVFDFVVVELPQPPPTADGSTDGPLVLKNQWPEYPPDLRDACEEYAAEAVKLSYKLLELIALSLGLPAKRLNGFFGDEQTSFIRFNHYPPCPSPDLTLGVGRHKDPGALTVLFQDDVGGLEVKRKSEGEWVRVKPIPDSYIINVGDIIQVWSNDRYESAEHRAAVNSERDRLSISFVFCPGHQTMVGPLTELVDDDNPSRYEEYNWGEFYKARNNGNLKKLGVENVQISHYKRA